MTVASHSSGSSIAQLDSPTTLKTRHSPYAWSFPHPIRIRLHLNIESSTWGCIQNLRELFREQLSHQHRLPVIQKKPVTSASKDWHLGTIQYEMFSDTYTLRGESLKNQWGGRRLSISDSSRLELERGITVHLLVSRISQDHCGRYPEIQSRWRHKSEGIICHLRWEISTKVPWRSRFQSQMWQS